MDTFSIWHWFTVLLIMLAIYFLPTIVGAVRGLRSRRDQIAVFLVNLLVGWTLIGWVVALVMAVIYPQAEPKQVIPAPRKSDLSFP